MKNEGNVLPAFNIETVPVAVAYDSTKAERIRRMSREKYGKPAAEVNDQILYRRRFFLKETQLLQKKRKPRKDPEKRRGIFINLLS
jgi:hypothetical protein